MALLTNFLKLLKPEKNDYVNVEKHISGNYDKIDNKMNELSSSNDKKLNKGSLPATITDAKEIYDLLENNGGINIDTALLYLNDTGTKTQGKVYFDKNKKGLFECIKTTTSTVNSTEFFVDISNKASSDRLTNLITVQSDFSSLEDGKSTISGMFSKILNNVIIFSGTIQTLSKHTYKFQIPSWAIPTQKIFFNVTPLSSGKEFSVNQIRMCIDTDGYFKTEREFTQNNCVVSLIYKI